MKTYDYKGVPLVAHQEPGTGLLVVYALLDGVEVPIAAHKVGHFAHKLKEAHDQRVAAEQEKAAAPATATVEAPVVPHDPGASSSAAPSSSTPPIQ